MSILSRKSEEWLLRQLIISKDLQWDKWNFALFSVSMGIFGNVGVFFPKYLLSSPLPLICLFVQIADFDWLSGLQKW